MKHCLDLNGNVLTAIPTFTVYSCPNVKYFLFIGLLCIKQVRILSWISTWFLTVGSIAPYGFMSHFILCALFCCCFVLLNTFIDYFGSKIYLIINWTGQCLGGLMSCCMSRPLYRELFLSWHLFWETKRLPNSVITPAINMPNINYHSLTTLTLLDICLLVVNFHFLHQFLWYIVCCLF